MAEDLRISVVIPAHNEEAVVGRLLDGLVQGVDAEILEVIVVCNGCTDDTSFIASSFAPDVRVVELAEASKSAAMTEGDRAASHPLRVYVDADVEITSDSIIRLAGALRVDGYLAAGPRRRIATGGSSSVVRWYYDVWERLPQVRHGLFGRGVIGLSGRGCARMSGLPAMMGDDLIASEAFAPEERTVVESAVVTIHPPRTTRDLIQRRVRVATGNRQADDHGLRHGASKTSARSLAQLVRSEPRLAARVPIFAAVVLTSRLLARRSIARGDFETWRRDESSRP